MTTQTLEMKGNSITIPKESARGWSGARVLVSSSEDTIVIKRAQPSTFWQTWEKLGQAKGRVSQKDIAESVKWARR